MIDHLLCQWIGPSGTRLFSYYSKKGDHYWPNTLVYIRLDSIRSTFWKYSFHSIRFDNDNIKSDSIRFDNLNIQFVIDSIRLSRIESNRIKLFAYSIRFRSLIFPNPLKFFYFIAIKLYLLLSENEYIHLKSNG